MVQMSRRIVILLSIATAWCELVNCTQFPAVFDADGNRQCAVGQPDDVRLSTNTATLECLRLCDNNPECVVFNHYDNTTCEIFTCSFLHSLRCQLLEFCKSFRVSRSSHIYLLFRICILCFFHVSFYLVEFGEIYVQKHV